MLFLAPGVQKTIFLSYKTNCGFRRKHSCGDFYKNYRSFLFYHNAKEAGNTYMNEFKTYHPIVNFIYFVFVIGFAMFLMHPVCLCMSFFSAFMHCVLLKGKKAIRFNIVYMFPMIIVAVLMNVLFNHKGLTILGYMPSGNPITAESILYGISAALMIVTVICWFSSYNEVMTGDKFIYLFGKVIPSLSLIISMTFRFVPKFFAQFKVVTNAQRCMGADISKGSIIQRVRHGLNILSIMITWCMENAIETADSMKSRGYGLKGRTAFSIFKFDNRDKKSLMFIVILGIYTLVGNMVGSMNFAYFPAIMGADVSLYNISVFVSYFILCIFPVLIELWEVRKWKSLKQKI